MTQFKTLTLPVSVYNKLEKEYSPLYAGLIWAIMALPHCIKTKNEYSSVLYFTTNFIKANSTLKGNSFSASVLLDKVIALTGITITTTKVPCGPKNKNFYTIITSRTLPDKFEDLFREAHSYSNLKGQQWGANNKPVILQRIPDEVEPTLDQAQVIEILEANSNRWNGLNKGLNLALQEVLTWPEGDQKLYSLSTLRKCIQDPVTQYGPVANSMRLYGKGPVLIYLPKAIRDNVILPELDFLSLDLISCQYFIAVKLWNIETNFLSQIKQGHSIWETLQASLPFGSKDLFKEAIYGTIFGCSWDRKTANGLSSIFEKHNALHLMDLFKAIPEVQALYAAREARALELAKVGYLSLLDGSILAYSEQFKASIICQEIQDYEAYFIRELIKVLNTKKDTYVTALLHDGIWVRTSNHERTFHLACRVLEKTLEIFEMAGGLSGSSSQMPEAKKYFGLNSMKVAA